MVFPKARIFFFRIVPTYLHGVRRIHFDSNPALQITAEQAKQYKEQKESGNASASAEVVQAPEILMPTSEALTILQIEQPYDAETVEARYDKLFTLNDPAKGGSFYLQCKVIGAKMTLLSLLPKDQQHKGEEEDDE